MGSVSIRNIRADEIKEIVDIKRDTFDEWIDWQDVVPQSAWAREREMVMRFDTNSIDPGRYRLWKSGEIKQLERPGELIR